VATSAASANFAAVSSVPVSYTFTTPAAVQAAPALANINASSVTTTTATLNWSAASGALSYAVSIAGDAGTGVAGAVTGAGPFTSSLTSLVANTTYVASIIAYSAAGQTGVASAPALYTFTTPATTQAFPVFATATLLTSAACTLSWSIAGTQPASYTLSLAGGASATLPTLTGASVSAALTGLAAGTAYTATLYATNASGVNSSPVEYAFTTPAAVQAAPALANINASSVTTTTATLNWSAASGAASYAVSIAGDAGSAAVGTVTGGPSSYTSALSSLVANTTYVVSIIAYSAASQAGVASAPALYTFTTPPAVTVPVTPAFSVVPAAGAAGIITFTLAALPAGATAYMYTIAGSGVAAGGLAVVASAVAAGAVTITGLTSGVSYNVVVQAYNNAGMGAPVLGTVTTA